MSTTLQSQSEQYDYEQEMDDERTSFSFGKFKDLTPLQLSSTKKGREYIIWAHRNTHHWIGSEELVKGVFKLCGEKYVPRSARPIRTPVPQQGDVVAACEAATLEAFGRFPKQLWMY